MYFKRGRFLSNGRLLVLEGDSGFFGSNLIIGSISEVSESSFGPQAVMHALEQIIMRLAGYKGNLCFVNAYIEGIPWIFLVVQSKTFFSSRRIISELVDTINEFSRLGVIRWADLRQMQSIVRRVFLDKRIFIYLTGNMTLKRGLRETTLEVLKPTLNLELFRDEEASIYLLKLLEGINLTVCNGCMQGICINLKTLLRLKYVLNQISSLIRIKNQNDRILMVQKLLKQESLKIKVFLGVPASLITNLSEMYNDMTFLPKIPLLAIRNAVLELKIKKEISWSTNLVSTIYDKQFLEIKISPVLINDYLKIMLYVLLASRRTKQEYPDLITDTTFARGDIHIGWQMKNATKIMPFFISYDDIKRHVVILGRTGMGKTRLAKIILDHILKRGLSNVWIFDFHKEYMDMYHRYPMEYYEPGLDGNSIQINIFDSKNEEVESYASFLSSLLLESIRLKGDEITPQMERALTYGVYETVTTKGDPTKFLEILYKWCQASQSDLPTAIYTFYAIVNRIKPLFSGVSKNIFWVTRSNFDIDDLIRSNVIIDLSYMFKRNMKREISLLINILLRYALMTLFQRKNIRERKAPDIIFLIEEGRYLVPWRKVETTMDTTAIEDFATLARKYGLSLMVISQSPILISRDILANAGTMFLFNTELPEQERPIIENETLRKFIQIMPPKQAIVRLISKPILLHVEIKDYIQKDHTESPTEIKRKSYTIETDFEELIKKITQNEI